MTEDLRNFEFSATAKTLSTSSFGEFFSGTKLKNDKHGCHIGSAIVVYRYATLREIINSSPESPDSKG